MIERVIAPRVGIPLRSGIGVSSSTLRWIEARVSGFLAHDYDRRSCDFAVCCEHDSVEAGIRQEQYR